MEVTAIVFNQVLIMFLLMLVGFVLAKAKILNHATFRGLCSFLLVIIIPATILHAYMREFYIEEARQLGVSFVIAIAFHFMAIVVSAILFRKKADDSHKMKRLGAVYSNAGFMAFPLLAAVFGDKGIFLGSAYIAIFNVFVWIHGIKTLQEKERIGLKKILFNPGTIAVALGLLTYFLRLTFPPVVGEAVRMIGSINTPLAMVVIGGFVAMVSPKEMFQSLSVVWTSLVKLLLLPLLLLAILLVAQVSRWPLSLQVVALAAVISAACPTAATVVLLPESLGLESNLGVRILVLCTLFSIITLPFVVFLAQLIIG